MSNQTHSIAKDSRAKAWVVLLVTLLLGVVVDLGSKSLAFERVAGAPVRVERAEVLAAGPAHLGDLIRPHRPVVVARELLEFTLVLNPGAVFGMGAGKRWIFVAFTVAALAFGIYLFHAWTRPRDYAAHVGLGLILSGGLGNLYDRLVYACVRDFIHPLPGVALPFGWNWPGGDRAIWPWVSNIADLALIIGVALMMWYTLRSGGKHPDARANETNAA